MISGSAGISLLDPDSTEIRVQISCKSLARLARSATPRCPAVPFQWHCASMWAEFDERSCEVPFNSSPPIGTANAVNYQVQVIWLEER
jgi:hypothetical protein